VSIAAKFLLTEAIWNVVEGVQPPPATVVTGRPPWVSRTTPENPSIFGTRSMLTAQTLDGELC
jgi:hypothetical protein